MQVERHGHVDPANGRREGEKEMDLSGIYWWKCHKNLDGICSNNNNIVLLLQDCQNYEQKPFTVLLYYRFNDCRMYSSAQFSPVTQSCPTLCDPMDCSTSGFAGHHQLPEHAQTHICWVGDAIQPSHPLSPPSAPALNLSQHHGLFQWIGCSHQVAQNIGASASTSALPMNFWDWSPLELTGWISLWSKGLSRVFSRTTVQKHPFLGAQLSLWFNSHIHTWLLEKA